MVLQQQKPIRVWGWATPGKTVTVMLTEDRAAAEAYLTKSEPAPATDERTVRLQYQETNAPDFRPQTRTAKADAEGLWLVTFDPVKASFTPKYLVATSGTEGAAIGNILIGEVWVCSRPEQHGVALLL